MQHDVIHPPDPFGLPLEYSLLPQELKKVGKCENYQQTRLAAWLCFIELSLSTTTSSNLTDIVVFAKNIWTERMLLLLQVTPHT